MTRIGFAYNQKPDQAALRLEDDDAPRPDEEPPSIRRDTTSRPLASPASAGEIAAASPAPSPLATIGPDPGDEFAEWDSAETIAAVEQALSGLGEVVRLEANGDFPERLRASRPDIVFNMAEGLRGVNREAHVPAMCEFFGVPYSGSDPFTLSLCLDKARTKEYLAYHGVPTAPFFVARSVDALRTAATSPLVGGARRLEFPLFVKPVHEGSSKGITERNYCRTPKELEEQVAFLLERYAQPVLVEEFLPGAEFTCAVLGNGEEARVLPIVGMRFDALPTGAIPVYGFEAKWLWDTPERPLEIFDCPARIDEALRCRIEEVVLAAYRVLACRDWSRIDVRLDAAGVPNVVEVNPLPGILPDPADNSCLPKAARAAGMSYDELIQACVRHAAERQGVPLSGKAVRRASDGRRRAAALG
jgi:D-alanine-D-alanine ligase